ncbi:GNAT family N-acetyltransferase [Streptomyces sp. NPDC020817]|uniref:GNAT family N-acetyltransferase n=1 Tax=Streptomyces sp. NPDC020817 TaxID=3365095 RepID=UPI003789A570
MTAIPHACASPCPITRPHPSHAAPTAGRALVGAPPGGVPLSAPWGPNTEAQTHDFADSAVKAWSQTPQHRFPYVARAGRDVVGMGELHVRSHKQRQGEIAYIVQPRAWGQGIGTAIGRQLLAHLGYGRPRWPDPCTRGQPTRRLAGRAPGATRRLPLGDRYNARRRQSRLGNHDRAGSAGHITPCQGAALVDVPASRGRRPAPVHVPHLRRRAGRQPSLPTNV